MAYSLDELVKDLRNNKYVPKTNDQLQQQAQNRYQSTYDQRRLAAQQGFETSDLALAQNADRTGQNYQKQIDQSAQQYRQAYSQADRQMLGRGMQRSSYGAQVLGNINVAGSKAADEIRTNQNQALGHIGDQRALLAQQLAKQLEGYTGQQAADTLAYMDELEAREYDRGDKARMDANSLAAQIYQFANQEKQQNTQQQQWLQQFNEGVRQYDKNYGLDQQRMAEQTRQYDTSFAEQQRQFDASLQADQRKLDEQIRQFETSLTEQQRQFDTSTAEGRRQFDASLTMDQKRLDEQIRQFEAQMAENKRQFDAKNKPAATGGGTPPKPKDDPPAPPTDDELMNELDKGFERKTNKNETYLDWSKRTQLLPNLAKAGITPQNTPPSGLGLPKVPLTSDAMKYIGEFRNVQKQLQNKTKTGGR